MQLVHIGERFHASRLDAEIAVRLRLNGYDRSEVVKAIQIGAAAQRPNERHDWQEYAERTTAFAFGIPGRRLAERLRPGTEKFLRMDSPREASLSSCRRAVRSRGVAYEDPTASLQGSSTEARSLAADRLRRNRPEASAVVIPDRSERDEDKKQRPSRRGRSSNDRERKAGNGHARPDALETEHGPESVD